LRCLLELPAHDHAELEPQAIGNEQSDGGDLPVSGCVECQERLGGLHEYDRRVA
jgi:hypothetical protein